MSKSRATEQDVLNMIFKGIDPAWRTNANRYVALHTGALNDMSTASSNEASYQGYARVTTTASDWNVTSNGEVTNANPIVFPAAGASANQTITHFSITTGQTGNSQILYFGQLQNPVTVTSGIQVTFPAGAILIKEN